MESELQFPHLEMSTLALAAQGLQVCCTEDGPKRAETTEEPRRPACEHKKATPSGSRMTREDLEGAVGGANPRG